MTFHQLIRLVFPIALVLSLSLTGCTGPAPEDPGPFTVLISSEAAFLKPMLEKAIRDKGLEPSVKVGSSSLELAETLTKTDSASPDAIAIAGATWLPDTVGAKLLGPPETIAWSPAVIGFKPGVATGDTIPFTELLTILSKNPNSVLVAHADGSDASVLFWLGALSAKKGSGTLKEGELRTPELDATFSSLKKDTIQVDEATRPLLAQAQSTIDKLKGVITYEANIQQLNQQLEAAKKPKLHSTRLQKGTLSGTITLSLAGKSPKKQEVFQAIVQALREESNQKAIQEKGWRTTAPEGVLPPPTRGTLWAAKRRFGHPTPRLAVQTGVGR